MATLAESLLEQAQFLASRESKRPREASLRRAVSTAYYAVFHLLTSDAAAAMAANSPDKTRHKIQRWFSHNDMQRACGHFTKAVPGSPLQLVLATISPDLQFVAKTFIQLQQQRHAADYDLSAVFTRVTAQAQVDGARQVFSTWQRIKRTEEADVFRLSLLTHKSWEIMRQ